MNKTLWKDTLRLINNQRGRYLAVALIVTIGTSFYTGITASSTMMAQNVDAYNDSLNLKDITIYSNLGFDDNDLAAINALEDVALAEGSKFADVMSSDGVSTAVTRIHSYDPSSEINRFVLVDGRLPENDSEVLAEAGGDMDPGYAIGSTLTLTRPDDDLEDWITVDTVTVVGRIDTPVYLNMTKENSTLGNQYIGTYLYLPESAFVGDYDTEVNVVTVDGKSYNSFYQPYLDYIEPITEELETLAETQTVVRRQSLLDDAMEQYEEGEAEYEEGLETFNREIADAEAEIAEAWSEIRDGERQLADAQKQIDDGYAELETKTAEGQARIDDGWKQYEEGLAEYEQGLAEYESQKAELEKTKSEIDSGIAQIDAGIAQLQQAVEGYRQIEDGIAQIDAALPQLQSSYRTINGILRVFPFMENVSIARIQEFTSILGNLLPSGGLGNMDLGQLGLTEQNTLGEVRDALSAKESELTNTRAELVSQQQLIESSLAEQGLTIDGADAKIAELTAQRQELVDARAQIDSGLASGEAQLKEAEAQLQSAKAELEAGQKTLDEETASARQQLADGQAEINRNKAELESGKADLIAGEEELATQKADGQQQLEDAKAELLKAWDDIQALESGTWTILDRSKHYASETFKNTVGQMKAIADIFPVFFLLVAALVCLTTMTRMVDEERGQLGIMRALGYTRLQCAFRYLFYSGTAALIGCIFGAIIGMTTFPVIIYNAWMMMYILPTMKIYISWQVIFLAAAAFIGVILLTTWFTCRKDMREVPSQLLRPKSPKLGKATLIEKIGFIWNNLNFTWKVTVRNLLRYKKRLVMTVIGVAGCTALMVIGFGVKDSVQSMVDLQFDEIQHYEGSAEFEDDILLSEQQAFAEELTKRDDVAQTELVTGYSTLIEADDLEETANLIVFTDDEQLQNMFTLRTRKGHDPVSLTDDGVIISEKLSENLELKMGDTISLESKDGRKRNAVIAGISEMYIQHFIFMSSDYYTEIFETAPGSNQVLIIEEEGADSTALQTDLLAMDEIASISFIDAVLANFQSMVNSLDLIVWVLIFSSMALAFVVLGNLTNINISERQREIATLKVLGFRKAEVQSYIFNEGNILTLLGGLVGLPMGNYLHHYIMWQVEMDYIMFGRSILPLSFVYALAFTVAFGFLVNFFMRKKLRGVQMAESLKSVE